MAMKKSMLALAGLVSLTTGSVFANNTADYLPDVDGNLEKHHYAPKFEYDADGTLYLNAQKPTDNTVVIRNTTDAGSDGAALVVTGKPSQQNPVTNKPSLRVDTAHGTKGVAAIQLRSGQNNGSHKGVETGLQLMNMDDTLVIRNIVKSGNWFNVSFYKLGVEGGINPFCPTDKNDVVFTTPDSKVRILTCDVE